MAISRTFFAFSPPLLSLTVRGGEVGAAVDVLVAAFARCAQGGRCGRRALRDGRCAAGGDRGGGEEKDKARESKARPGSAARHGGPVRPQLRQARPRQSAGRDGGRAAAETGTASAPQRGRGRGGQRRRDQAGRRGKCAFARRGLLHCNPGRRIFPPRLITKCRRRPDRGTVRTLFGGRCVWRAAECRHGALSAG